jgi:hypothetical protein
MGLCHLWQGRVKSLGPEDGLFIAPEATLF